MMDESELISQGHIPLFWVPAHEEYFYLLCGLLVACSLTFIIVFLSLSFPIQNEYGDKLTPYECGFEPYQDSRVSFELHFCLVAIIFVIFDVEIILLSPWVVSLSKIGSLGFWSGLDFIFELSLGILYVWQTGALDWN